MHDEVITGPLAWALFVGWSLVGLLFPFAAVAVWCAISAAGRKRRMSERRDGWASCSEDDGRWAA